MTLSPDDLAAMGRRHRPMEVGTLPDEEACRMCGGYWPCDSRRLLDEVEAARRDGERKWLEQHAITETWVKACNERDKAIKRLRRALAQVAAREHIPPCDETVWDYCACLYNIAERALNPEEVMTQTANEPST